MMFKSATFANFKDFFLLLTIKRFLPAELQIMIQPFPKHLVLVKRWSA